MEPLSPALVEAYGGAPPVMINETALSREHLPGYSHSYCFKDRDLGLHLRIFDLSVEDFSDGDRLLVIGSGTTRRFERELAEVRPDIAIVSVDPLLRYGVSQRLQESIRMGAFSFGGKYGVRFPYELDSGEAYFRPGAVCGGIALAGSKRDKSSYLPFKDNTFQHVLGLHSLPQYCKPEDAPDVMKDVLRVMEPGTTARFYPVFPDDETAILASDLGSVASSLLLDGETIHRWYWDGASGTKRLVLTK